jgi:hypothetical protein
VQSNATTVDEYLAELPPDRRETVRFTKLDDVPVDVVGAAIARTSVDDFIAAYERSRR